MPALGWHFCLDHAVNYAETKNCIKKLSGTWQSIKNVSYEENVENEQYLCIVKTYLPNAEEMGNIN